MMLDILVFVLLQGLAINGVHRSMDEGMILSWYRNWLKKQRSWIGKPMGLCIICMSSVGGTLTFWPTALYVFGWNPIEIFAWVFDMFILVYINFFLYKKL